MTTTAATLPSDPALPQLHHAWNTDLMREAFRAGLVPRAGREPRIEGCALRRFRYRQGSRAIVLYELRVVEPATGRDHRQWATVTLCRGGKAARIHRALERRLADAGAPDPGALFEPLAYLGDLGMVLQLFPLDRHLPALSTLMAGPPPGLESLLLESFGSGPWTAAGWDVQPVRYRPGLSATLRLDLQAAQAASVERRARPFYLKLGRADGQARTYQLLSSLGRAGERGSLGFEVPRPVAYLPGQKALVLERATGRSLQSILCSGGDSDAALRQTARALAAFHRCGHVVPGRRSRDDRLARVERTARYLAWACPTLGDEIDRTFESIRARLEEVTPHPAHLDLKADHVIVDGDRVTFIDLDSCAASDPVFDVATFCARLDSAPGLLPLSHTRARAAATLFAEAYFAEVPASWRGRYAQNYACAALQVARGCLQQLKPDWAQKIAAAVASARGQAR